MEALMPSDPIIDGLRAVRWRKISRIDPQPWQVPFDAAIRAVESQPAVYFHDGLKASGWNEGYAAALADVEARLLGEEIDPDRDYPAVEQVAWLLAERDGYKFGRCWRIDTYRDLARAALAAAWKVAGEGTDDAR
jgi:hypothetical protein